MRRSLLFAALALCAFRTVPPSSIRHLTFDVAYRSTSEAEIRYGDFDRSGTRLVLGPEVRRHGTIDVSVVAAPADGKLVVDVSERADLARRSNREPQPSNSRPFERRSPERTSFCRRERR